MDGIPAEAWAIVATVISAIISGVGVLYAQRAKKAEGTADALQAANDRLVAAAEKREDNANSRLDRAMDGMEKLTAAVVDNTGIQKLLADKVAKIEANQEALIQELRYARRQ